MPSDEVTARWRTTKTYQDERERVKDMGLYYIETCRNALIEWAADDELNERNPMHSNRLRIRALACADLLEEETNGILLHL